MPVSSVFRAPPPLIRLKGEIMKNYRYYTSLERLIFTVVLLSLFMIGCANNEADKRIKTAENLYREYKGDPKMAQNRLAKALNEYQRIIDNFPSRVEDIEYILYQMWKENYKPPEPDYEAAGSILEKLAKNFQAGLWTSDVKSRLWLIAYDEKNKHNYEEARRAYRELVDNFPKDAGAKIAWYELGEANYKLGNYEETRKAFRVFIYQSRVRNSYMGREARRLIAQSYLDQRFKDYHQAYLNFDKLTTAAFKNDPKLQAEAMYKTAYCLNQLRDNDEALGRYAEFMTRFPNSEYSTNAYFDLGVLYAYNKKDYELARFNYNRALQSPDSPSHSKAEIQLEIGFTYYNQGYFEKASNVCNLLLQEYPESEQVSMARLLIADVHKKEKRAEEVIRVCENIIANHTKKKPVDYYMDDGLSLEIDIIPLSYGLIGASSSEKEDFERAFSAYARIVKKPDGEEADFRKDPSAPFALHSAMEALCKLGRKNELETFATTYINELGDIKALMDDELILSAEAQRRFADVLREELNQYDKAAAEYAKLQDYPPKSYLRLNLIKLRGKYYEGFCYENGTTLNKSTEAYQEVIRLFESVFRPLINNPHINVPNITKGEFDYCIRTACYYVGNSYFATNQFDKAIAEFKEFLKRVESENQKFKKLKEMIKIARDKIEEARRNLGAKAERPKSSSDKSNSSVKSETEKNSTLDQKLVQRARESTVFLTMEYADPEKKGTGSGFFVGPDLIATNYHVVKEAVEGTARIVKTGMTYAIVGYTAVDPDRDLAILKVRAFDVKPLLLGDNNDISNNIPIYVVGNPKGIEGTLSEGVISNSQPIRNILIDGKQVKIPLLDFQMTAPISPGNSGGPVLNRKGRVIGVSVATFRDIFIHEGEVRDYTDRFPIVDKKGKKIPGYYVDVPKRDAQNINYAIPVNDLKALLKRAGPLKPLSDLEVVN